MTAADFHLPAPLLRVLTNVARAACPDDLDELGLTDEVAATTAEYMRSLPGYIRAGLVAGLTAFEAAAMVLPGSLGRPYSTLDRERARAVFERWWGSRLGPLHQFARSLKALLVAAYYEHPTIRARMGFTPERWIAEVTARREAGYAADIRRHEELLRTPDPLVPAAGRERRTTDAR